MDKEEKIPLPERGFYYHFKRTPNADVSECAYELVGVGKHTEDDSLYVVYRPLYVSKHLFKGVKYFIRPLSMWEEEVQKDGVSCKRFQKITDAEIIKTLKNLSQ